MNDDVIYEWERAAHPKEDHPGVPSHSRGSGLSASTPAARVVELTQILDRTRGFLGEACVALRRSRAASSTTERFHTMKGTSFSGVACAQIWADFVLWESVLNENPDVRGIVEIGTWKGGFSLWLHAQAEARDIFFRTFDAVAPERSIPHFVRCDVFADPDTVGLTIQQCEPVILLCDGGNKPRELRTFPATYFRDPRSLVVVHDWRTETLPSDVPPILEEVYGDFCDEIGSISRVFRVRR